MHSVSDPADEAERLYVQQARLAERLFEKELVIWDVGLGAASNAMAAIQCFERAWGKASAGSPPLPARILSFERDLDPLLLASKHAVRFPHLRHGAPYSLLEKGRWTHFSGLLSWELIQGDFLETHSSAAVPDMIFYDPFSYKVDSDLWTAATFSRIRGHIGSHVTELYTYSASTAVRAALLYAGFFVARGTTTGPKAETTVAFTDPARERGMTLGHEWLERWHRSGAKFPEGLSEAERGAFEARICGHPQFRD